VKKLEEDFPHSIDRGGCPTSHSSHSSCYWNIQRHYDESWQWSTWAEPPRSGAWW